MNPKVSFFYVPSLTIQQNIGGSFLNGATSQESAVLNALGQTFSSDLGSYKVSNNLMARINGEKRGRSFFVQVKNDIDRTSGTSLLNATNLESQGITSNVDQLGDLDEQLDGWKTSLMYSEPLGKGGMGAFISYDFANSASTQNLQTISGVIAPGIGTYDSSLSSRYNNDWNTHTAGLGLRKFSRKGGFVVRAKFETAILNNSQVVPENTEIKTNLL